MEESEVVTVPEGEVVAESVSELYTMGQLEYTPPPPVIIRLDDILNEVPILAQREAQDKATLEGIANQSFDSLKSKLIEWALQGFRNAFPLFEITINPPDCCSDGGHRTLTDYIQYCSGKTIHEHIVGLQDKMPDFVVSFSRTSQTIQIVVSKST